jgi:hypothetical protein
MGVFRDLPLSLLPNAVNIHDIFTYLATSTPEGVAAMRDKFAGICYRWCHSSPHWTGDASVAEIAGRSCMAIVSDAQG